jgi:hypothetical protein
MTLDRALAYAGGTHTASDVTDAVTKGELQRWDGEHSVIITELRQTPRQRFLLFFLAEGNMAELRAMAPAILAWGKEQGCQKAQLVGRHGWQRSWLVQDNWKPVAVMMEKALE